MIYLPLALKTITSKTHSKSKQAESGIPNKPMEKTRVTTETSCY